MVKVAKDSSQHRMSSFCSYLRTFTATELVAICGLRGDYWDIKDFPSSVPFFRENTYHLCLVGVRHAMYLCKVGGVWYIPNDGLYNDGKIHKSNSA